MSAIVTIKPILNAFIVIRNNFENDIDNYFFLFDVKMSNSLFGFPPLLDVLTF